MSKRKRADGRGRWRKSRTSAAASTSNVRTETATDAANRADTFVDRIAEVPSMLLYDLPDIVDEGWKRCNVHLQERLIQACLRRILSHQRLCVVEPHDEQVRTLRRLIFTKSDVLLIARTGYGKSIIFHAYSILTRKITLQLVPLSKLGDEQLYDIRRFEGARPCLIDANTKAAEKKLLERVAVGEFTHVLLGPEQASSRPFRQLLKSPNLQARIGLVAIDECHLVTQWEEFRPAFTLLSELRTILHQDVVWFGCSATLDVTDTKRVLITAGFRRVGNRTHQTEVIRTSVDRPDVALSVIAMPRNKLDSWDLLYFLLVDAVSDGSATPSAIPKTIVFIDGRQSVQAAAAWAMDMLIHMSHGFDTASRYGTDSVVSEQCVFNVVRTFTSNVAQYDKNKTYKEFESTTSVVRIVFATTSLGMGINIPDVSRVVTWKLPITKTIADLWQRLGRGGRAAGHSSTGFILLPYWLFNSKGSYRPGYKQSSQSISQPNWSRRQSRNQLPANRAIARSRLSQMATPGDMNDVVADESQSRSRKAPDGRLYWTSTDVSHREAVPPAWLEVVNDSCHRRGFLKQLGEYELPVAMRQFVPMEQCCSACNPSLLPRFIPPPDRVVPLTQPRVGTLAGFVYEQFGKFAVERATKLFCGNNRRFPMPPGVYMDLDCRIELSYACVVGLTESVILPSHESETTLDDGSNNLNSTFDWLQAKVPRLSLWKERERDGEKGVLIAGLRTVFNAALQKYEQSIEERQRRHQERREATLNAPQSANRTDAVTSAEIAIVNNERDDELAVTVAVEVESAAQDNAAVRAYINNRDTDAHIPTISDIGIQAAVDRLARVRQESVSLMSNVARVRLNVETLVPPTLVRVRRDCERSPPHTLGSATHKVSRTHNEQTNASGRSALKERDAATLNQMAIPEAVTPSRTIELSATSKRGRKRKLTEKGEGVWNIRE